MRHAAGLLVVLAYAVASSGQSGQRTLTFAERVQAQKAIEQVYWSHRIWPKENPTAKPPLSAVVSDGAIQSKVEDYLKKSNALERTWRRPITAEQLQAEIDRMSNASRDPQTLSELFAALGNDPFVIAETLGRQTLADRLIHNWYVSDTRIHGEVRKKAEAELATCARADCMKSLGGDYRETIIRLRGESRGTIAERPEGAAIDLGADAWADELSRLAATLGATPQSLPTGRLGGLEETDDAFVARAVLSRRDGEIVTASLAWPKRAFDAWWAAERDDVASVIDPPRAAYSVPPSRASSCTNDTWMATGGANPDLRTQQTAVWTGSEMIFWGGQRAVTYLTVMNTGSRYNPSTDTWNAISTGANVPTARYLHTAVWSGTEMIVWGGSNGASGLSETNSGGRYNPSTDSWTPTAAGASAPVARYQHTAVWTGSKMIIWGGQHCIAAPGCSGVDWERTGGIYDPSSDTWTATSTGANVPVAQAGHVAVWTGTEMIVWFGEQTGHSGRYNPSSDTWLALGGLGDVPISRGGETAVWTGTEMIVWGGQFNSNALNSGGRYSPSTDRWTATSTGQNVPPARYNHTAVWTGTEMIVWGGLGPGGWLNSGGRYDPSTNSWTPTSTGANDPFGRRYHTAVWTGTEMIVWGGSYGASSSAITNTGGRYNPSTDSWTATAARPEAADTRANHASVWTGTEMIVWGGSRGSAYYNTGGRYNPTADSWIPTSTTGAPIARTLPTPVWSGTEMIVWGGVDFNTGLRMNSGGRYNPLTDSWATTSTGTDNPTARYAHTAVWTGTQMIVWGGDDGTSRLNTGGRYNPLTNSWTATSTGANIPTARYFHTAVWTGTEMVVWGGSTGSGSLNTGGRYNPVTDSWAATSTSTNNPTARSGHTAAWTGTEMIVWGGFAGDTSFVNTGGRYNPLSDGWTATSTGATDPTAREWATAVWTGSEMIVWGGYQSPASLNTGGRYSPLSDSWTATSTGANNPTARYGHTAVWTGTQMIVWGGDPASAVGGRYCACPNGRIYYRDADGDGFGNPAVAISVCDGSIPAGYAANDTDCNDAVASIHPNAPEINDGIDNQCPGDPDYGVIDEISGTCGFTSPGDKTRFAWNAQGGATSYDVARSKAGDFSFGCTLFSTNQPFIVDPEPPVAGGGFYYLVRPAAPHAGDWGTGIGGVPRTVTCAASAEVRRGLSPAPPVPAP